jgi:hypothetical protein
LQRKELLGQKNDNREQIWLCLLWRLYLFQTAIYVST